MTLVYISDTTIEDDGKNFYSNSTISMDTISLYKKVYDKLIILAKKVQKVNKSSKVILEGMNSVQILNIFWIFRNYNLIKKKEVIVLIRLPEIKSNLFAIVLLLIKKKYNVEVVGSGFFAYYHHSFLGLIVAPIVHLMTKITVMLSNSARYVTKIYLQNEYPIKQKAYSFSDVVIKEVNFQNSSHKISQIMGKNLEIVTIGALDVSYKNQQLVIKAIPILLKFGYKVKYHLIGQGSPKKLTRLAKKLNIIDNIHVYGFCNKEKINQIFNKCNTYIQPSLTEGLPRSLIEAMSFGLICYGSSVGGIPELLNKDYLFNPQNNKELLNKLINSKNIDLISHIEKNFNTVNHFTYKNFYGKTMNYLNEIKYYG